MQDLPMKLKFSTPESFQIVMTGLKYLRAYEREADSEVLDRATETLATGMRKFPEDIAPRFYMGVAKAVSGARNSWEGIKILEDLLQRIGEQSIKDLTLAVKYNLACAYAGTYQQANLDRARELLNEILTEIGELKAPADNSLRLQVEVLLIWLDLREVYDDWLDIRNKRRKKATLEQQEVTEFKSTVIEIEDHLEKFKQRLDEQDLGEYERNEVLADYWNNLGIAELFLGEAEPDRNERIKHGSRALELFQESLEHKHDWPPPLSNMAIVYQDIIEDLAQAEKIWLSIVDTEPTHDFAKLNLGDIAAEKAQAEEKPNRAREYAEEAVKWYSETDSREGLLSKARILPNNLDNPQEAKMVLDELLEKLKPDRSDNWRYLGEAYHLMGTIQKQLGNDKAAKAVHDQGDHFINLYRGYRAERKAKRQRDPNKARSHREKAIDYYRKAGVERPDLHDEKSC